jgi:hypothetical protein
MELATVSTIKVAVAMMSWRMALPFGFDMSPHICALIALIRRIACDAGHSKFVPRNRDCRAMAPDGRFTPHSRRESWADKSAESGEKPTSLQRSNFKLPAYSITSSARPSSVSGKVMPSALAVLRLMNIWIFAACCTGRSAGRSPFRMRPV